MPLKPISVIPHDLGQCMNPFVFLPVINRYKGRWGFFIVAAATVQEEWKLWDLTSCTPLENWPCVEGLGKYIPKEENQQRD